MKIIVDADACPSIAQIELLAKTYQVELILYFDHTHHIESTYAKCITCDVGFQSVDMKLVNDVKQNDIVVTQDYGVAGIVLAKGAYAITPKGKIYKENTIDILFLERYLHQKERKKGFGKGPKKRTKEDEKQLLDGLIFLIKKVLENER